MAQLNDWSKMNQPRIGVDGRPVGESVTTPARSPVDDALDRLRGHLRDALNGRFVGGDVAWRILNRWDDLTHAEAQAEQLREERDAAEKRAKDSHEVMLRVYERAEAAEAEVRQLREAQASLLAEQVRLTEGLRDARSFASSIQRNEGQWENQAGGLISRIDALLSANPPQGDAAAGSSPSDGEAIAVDETGVLPSGRHISVFDAEDEDGGGAK